MSDRYGTTRDVEVAHPTYRDNYSRRPWFPNDEHCLIDIEQGDLWALQDQLREAEARNDRLLATNRELKIRFDEMKAELVMMASERKLMLGANPDGGCRRDKAAARLNTSAHDGVVPRRA